MLNFGGVFTHCYRVLATNNAINTLPATNIAPESRPKFTGFWQAPKLMYQETSSQSHLLFYISSRCKIPFFTGEVLSNPWLS